MVDTGNARTPAVTKAVVPAAGLGTRFLPATKATPKEMLPVVDKPAIQYVVEEAVSAGLNDVLLITGRSKRSIEDHFDRNYELEEALTAKEDWDKLALVRESLAQALRIAFDSHLFECSQRAIALLEARLRGEVARAR